MCSKHFVGGNGPSKDNPDPLPASATDFEVRVLSSKRKRKSPAQRSTLEISLSKSRKNFLVDNETEYSEILFASVDHVVVDHICYTKPLPNPVEVPSRDDGIKESVFVFYCESNGSCTGMLNKF